MPFYVYCVLSIGFDHALIFTKFVELSEFLADLLQTINRHMTRKVL